MMQWPLETPHDAPPGTEVALVTTQWVEALLTGATATAPPLNNEELVDASGQVRPERLRDVHPLPVATYTELARRFGAVGPPVVRRLTRRGASTQVEYQPRAVTVRRPSGVPLLLAASETDAVAALVTAVGRLLGPGQWRLVDAQHRVFTVATKGLVGELFDSPSIVLEARNSVEAPASSEPVVGPPAHHYAPPGVVPAGVLASISGSVPPPPLMGRLPPALLPSPPPPLLPPGLCGFVNAGNTCYLNAGLQCLLHLAPLRAALRSHGAVEAPSPLTLHLSAVAQAMWDGPPRVLGFGGLRAVINAQEQFSAGRQHDSHELVTFVLDTLHEEWRAPAAQQPPPPPPESSFESGASEQEAAERAWAEHVGSGGGSAVVRLFHGLLRSRLVCPDCGAASVKCGGALHP